jgi:hypothetical protein
VNESSVRKAIRDGRITVDPDGLIDFTRADRQWSANTAAVGSDPAFQQARTHLMATRAIERQEKLRRLKSSLVDKKAATELLQHLGDSGREAWRHWPAKVAPKFAAEIERDPAEVEAMLQRHVDQFLAELGPFIARID